MPFRGAGTALPELLENIEGVARKRPRPWASRGLLRVTTALAQTAETYLLGLSKCPAFPLIQHGPENNVNKPPHVTVACRRSGAAEAGLRRACELRRRG